VCVFKVGMYTHIPGNEDSSVRVVVYEKQHANARTTILPNYYNTFFL
jgi:hypothetical protein